MLLSQGQPSAVSHAPLTSARALLLCPEDLTLQDRNLTKILDFLGIPWQALTVGELLGVSLRDYDAPPFCILGSASYLAQVLGDSPNSGDWPADLLRGATSVFLYGFQNTAPCNQLLRFLSGDADAAIRHLSRPKAVASIAGDKTEMCGPMSGMQVLFEPAEGDLAFSVTRGNGTLESIIKAEAGECFLSVTQGGARVYLSGASTITDISSLQADYFDVKKHFCGAVPTVMYLKWAFRGICWNSLETSGCVIIDDPPLTPRYGFLCYRKVLELMDQHNFTTTIAFIPWNWARTNPHAVKIFRERPDRFSLCVHGSDHMGNEFGTRSTAQLNRSVKTARQRMDLLRQETSLEHARVMVFPRGAFSPEAGRALKLSGFVAAANTEVAPTDKGENKTTVADLWSMAIMKYGAFPILTRRYPTHGVENFAFDGLLGKPCLIVGHHEAFKNQGHDLVEFIDKLNSLKWKLRWRSLGDLVRQSFVSKEEPDGTTLIQMFAHQLVIENQSAEPRRFAFLKEEADPDFVKAVIVNQSPVDFGVSRRFLRWNVTLPPGGTAEVSIAYFEAPDLVTPAEGIAYNIKTHTRRYLSELRDNYISQNSLLSAGAA